ncbi:MAG: quinoprotein dehydrogenase-associated putative ABC transporter substrate-binding protein [Luteimonas sp.]
MTAVLSRCHYSCVARRLLVAIVGIACCAGASARDLRVCADPNNLPFSNAAGEGFENRIVALLAKDLGANVEYTWWAQRRGAIRNTLNAGDCDVIPGMASSGDMTGTTDPYYRSTYVFVSRADRGLRSLTSLDDPRLRTLRIGVQLVGDDGANPPPAMSLARRGIVDNVRGFTVYGDYADKAPQAAVIQAVAHGDIDVALVWGPTAGYFAALSGVPMVLAPVTPWLDGPQSPMVFDISMGLRRDDRPLRRELDRALARNRESIDRILDDYHVPRVADPSATAAAQSRP